MLSGMNERADVVVVGAGVVGLACAAELSGRGRSVLVLERNGGIAQETTARNSEVVHAGLYYPPGSLKASLCTEGRELLWERCERLRLPSRRCGKLVVAVEESELTALRALAENAEANGVPELRLLDAAELAELEPEVRGHAALWSGRTGILDALALSRSFLAETESRGGDLALRTELRSLEPRSWGWRLELNGPDGSERLDCGLVVNCAGLAADRVAECAGVDVEAERLRLHPCKGDYFSLEPGLLSGIERLVYPLPGALGLGIHLTPDLGGRLRLGPDAEHVDGVRYDVDPAKAGAMAAAAQRFLPAVEARHLSPDFAGIRPRLAAPGEGFRDFVIRDEAAAGLPGLINCVGIESPGLTAAPAIARHVAGLA